MTVTLATLALTEGDCALILDAAVAAIRKQLVKRRRAPNNRMSKTRRR